MKVAALFAATIFLSQEAKPMSGIPRQVRLEKWIVPWVLIAFCASAIWLTLSFDRMPPILKRGIQPADFPQLICGLIILLTIFMAWKDPVRVTEPFGSKTLGSMALMVVFGAVSTIDLFLALGVFAGSLCFYWSERRLQIIALVGLLVPVSVFFLFDQIFEIRFPRGLLTNLWYG